MSEDINFFLFPAPNRDGKTWGWRWHNTSNNRDFGPTFPTMKKAKTWLENNEETATEQSAVGNPVEDVDDVEDNELIYESEDDSPADAVDEFTSADEQE